MSQVDEAVAVLRRGGLLGLPTETVYGLAADAENELAVRRIFAVKGRPSTHPLIVHLGDASLLDEWVDSVPPEARTLAAAFWPGPLTLVLARSVRASDAVTGGQGTVAVRVPSHPLALEVLRRFGGGVAAPSANRFGRVSPTRAEHVREDLGSDVDLVLDGGLCEVGVESTIVDLSGPVPALLRAGGLAVEALEAVLQARLARPEVSAVRTPGTLPSHYAPRAGVELTAAETLESRARALLAEGKRVAVLASNLPSLPNEVGRFELGDSGADQARTLYEHLRALDAQGFDVALAVLPPEAGLGLAVRDRLRRASAPR